MQEGGLAPNEIVQDILENHLVQNVMQNKTNFLVDGFPRNMEQASAFQDRVSDYCSVTIFVDTLYMDCAYKRRGGTSKPRSISTAPKRPCTREC